MLPQPDVAKAEEYFEHALVVAHHNKQQAKVLGTACGDEHGVGGWPLGLSGATATGSLASSLPVGNGDQNV
jgi:hypothetical protein